MLNICHIISGDLWAGAEVMTYNLLKYLKNYNDLELSVVILNEGVLKEKIQDLGIKFHLVDENQKNFFDITRRTRNILISRPPDIIHSHRYKENFLSFLISKSIKKSVIIGTQHGMPEFFSGKTKIRQLFITELNFFVLSRFFNRVVGVSHDIQNIFINRSIFKEERVSVIHNGIEVPEIETKNKANNHFVIGSCGRLFPVKDYPLMIDIAKETIKRSKDIIFQLAGDGPERKKLEALVKKYDLCQFFVFKGNLDDMTEFYRGLDLYLNTSIHEGIPMSILEAMAHGLPVIAPRVGGIKEILDEGRNGFLVSDRDPNVFAEKCLLLKNNRSLYGKMSFEARHKIVQNFSAEVMARKYYDLYHELAENR